MPTQRWAFKVGYLSSGFHGYAQQPDRPTVEGLLRKAIVAHHLVRDDVEARFQSASRTDRGVHALGNVIAFDTAVAGASVARALAALDRRLLCRGFAPVPDDFNPRDARGRWYRYLEPLGEHDVELWRETARLFEGEHDFAAFSRPDKAARSTRRRLQSVEVEADGNLLRIDLRGSAFLWGQVRKIVAALGQVEAGRLTAMEVQQALAGRRRLDLPLAPAERLILMDVEYAFPFTPAGPWGRAVLGYLEESFQATWSQQAVLRTFLDQGNGSGGPRRSGARPSRSRPT